ncbi:DUF7059 domain-containing protein [Kineococcus glutinatus]|uniref:Methyltransferase n=1 Tax=Kineococcus glutinatus TaxID=1070872 RepID=A0ABP9HF84_9ACTN
MSEPAVSAAQLIGRLRADLVAAEYTVERVEAVLGPVASAALGREQALPAVRAAEASGEPAAVLLRCLVLGRPVPRELLDAALPGLGTDGAVRLGLVRAAGADPGDEVRAEVELRPYAAEDAAGRADWWLVSDLGETATDAPLRTDHVLGVGGASVMLAQCTIRTPVGRVLDVGTGCGVQALHAARHARSVTATDVSERALDLAAVNAALNSVVLDLRHGSLLEPVAGERYDLVVSNPPFVITPRGGDVPRYEYRDGGLAGDAVVQRLVAGVAGVLEPGGVAQLLGNWEHRAGEGWRDRVGGWLEGTGLDAWVVQREVQDPAEYAELWIRDGGQHRGPAFESLYAAWLDDFAARGVEGVGFGLLTLRRPVSGEPTLRRLEEVPGPVRQPLGEHLAAGLAAHDWLAARDDDALAAARLRVAPDVTDERHHVPGEPDPSVLLLRQGGGFGRAVPASGELAGFVGACDGDLTVGQVLAGIAVILEREVAGVRAELLPVVRELVADGLLLPV